MIYRLNVRVLLLERVYSRMIFGLLVGAGATVAQARRELALALERDRTQIEAEIPSLVPRDERGERDPAQLALFRDEFHELAEGLKKLFSSYS